MGRRNWISVGGLTLGLGIFPVVGLFSAVSHYLDIMVFVGIHSLITLGLCLLMGYAGQISLGHAAFYGIGAYASGILSVKCGLDPWLAIPVGMALAAAVALLVGWPSMKLRGHYLAMATLGFGQIVFVVLNNWIALTDGPDGFGEIPRLSLCGLVFDTSLSYYYLVWAVVVVMLIFCLNIIHSRVGRALVAIHDSELAARSLGVNAAWFKLQIFVLSAVMAALAGSFYAHYVTHITPKVGDLFFSIKVVMMVVIGGMTSVWGAMVGAALLGFLPEWLIFLEDFDVLAYGLILLLIVMFFSRGLVDVPGAIYRRLAARRRSASRVDHG
jgi:branched-chain amino acid transport system permease protein